MKKNGRGNSHKTFSDRLPPSLGPAFLAQFNGLLDSCNAATALTGDLAFKFEYQKSSWLSKYCTVDKQTAKEREELAIAKWLAAEKRNQQTNERLLFDDVTFTGGITGRQILSFAKLVVRQTIGSTPNIDTIYGKFSNGASTRVKRAPDAIASKFVGEAHATAEALVVFKTDVLATSPAWVSAMMDGKFNPTAVPGSMMFTVPKNSEIDRVACKEPEVNMFLQRGAGLYIRRCLKSRGIDLQDQSRNQRLALEGSISRKLATLDLSSASDLISTQLVYELLPLDWFVYLDSIRVKRVLIGDEQHELNMFSSMGNGFTFELESLLFYALACAINRAYRVRGRISVYGDDIITPTCIAASYRPIFAWFGFKVNAKKSFWTGSFRESCGKHYVNGCDVTPFFLKGPLLVLGDLIHQLNMLREWATRNGDDFWSPELHSFWVHWSAKVPRFLYGGKDVQDKSCLTTIHRPRKRLTAAKEDEVNPNQLGAYLQWLHSTSTAPKEVSRWSTGTNCPTSVRRSISLGWLDWYERREPLVTGIVSREREVRITRNRSWNESLVTHLWWTEYASDDALLDKLLPA